MSGLSMEQEDRQIAKFDEVIGLLVSQDLQHNVVIGLVQVERVVTFPDVAKWPDISLEY